MPLSPQEAHADQQAATLCEAAAVMPLEVQVEEEETMMEEKEAEEEEEEEETRVQEERLMRQLVWESIGREGAEMVEDEERRLMRCSLVLCWQSNEGVADTQRKMHTEAPHLGQPWCCARSKTPWNPR